MLVVNCKQISGFNVNAAAKLARRAMAVDPHPGGQQTSSTPLGDIQAEAQVLYNIYKIPTFLF